MIVAPRIKWQYLGHEMVATFKGVCLAPTIEETMEVPKVRGR
jgi:hypothetical protein